MTDNFKIGRSEFNFLGTAVAKYKFPNEYLVLLNNLIDEKLKNNSLQKFSESLAGELENEYNLLNNLTYPILNAFNLYACNYLNRLQINFKKFKLVSCWFNEQKKYEYNPLHTHNGREVNTGISSVLYLKIPECIKQAKAKNRKEVPKDGRLEFIKESQTFLTNHNYIAHPVEGDFYLFPYNLHHCVYPFKGEGIRRSLSFNMDIIV